MFNLVIADTSCLIVLSKIGQIELLRQLFDEITITPEIAEEFGNDLPKWVIVKRVIDEKRKQILALDLDLGEASAIALAMESEVALLLIDERKGRQVAQQLKLPITGTLGVLIKAKEEGLIGSINGEVQNLILAGFRIAPKLVAQIAEKFENLDDK